MFIKLFGGRLTIGKDISQYTGTADNLYGFLQQRYGLDYASKSKLKMYRNVVYGCVSLIGEALSDYEPILEKKMGDQWKAIDHEFLQLLSRPSGRDVKASSMSKSDLFEATGIYQQLQGDGYWYMALGKSTGRPREIVLLRPDKVGTDIDPNTGDITGYFIRREIGEPIPLEVNEVLRFPTFNPEDPYKGMGPTQAGMDYIATDELTAKFTKNFFGNNAGLSGVLNIKGEVTKKAFRKFVRAWREKYEGVESAGKVAVIRDSDASFTKVGLGLGELDMASLRQMTLDDVFMMFKVPPALLGKLTDGTGLGRANIEVLEYIFAKWNIDKKMSKFDDVIMFALQRYYGLDTGQYRVVHRNIIPDDKEFELNARDKAVDRWRSRNEIRDQDGLDHVDGGDALYVALNEIPIGEPVPDGAAASTGKSTGVRIKIHRASDSQQKKKIIPRI